MLSQRVKTYDKCHRFEGENGVLSTKSHFKNVIGFVIGLEEKDGPKQVK